MGRTLFPNAVPMTSARNNPRTGVRYQYTVQSPLVPVETISGVRRGLGVDAGYVGGNMAPGGYQNVWGGRTPLWPRGSRDWGTPGYTAAGGGLQIPAAPAPPVSPTQITTLTPAQAAAVDASTGATPTSSGVSSLLDSVTTWMGQSLIAGIPNGYLVAGLGILLLMQHSNKSKRG